MKKLIVMMILGLGAVSSYSIFAVLPVPGEEQPPYEKPLFSENGEAELPLIRTTATTTEAELPILPFEPEMGVPEETTKSDEPILLGPLYEEPPYEKPLPYEKETINELYPEAVVEEGFVNYPLPVTAEEGVPYPLAGEEGVPYPLPIDEEEVPMAVEPVELGEEGGAFGGHHKRGKMYKKHGFKRGRRGGGHGGGKRKWQKPANMTPEEWGKKKQEWKQKRVGWKQKHANMTPEQRKQKREEWKKKHLTPEQQKQWEQAKKDWETKHPNAKPEEFKAWRKQQKEEWRKKKQQVQ